MPDTDSGFITMKKLVLVLSVMVVAMIVSASVFANSGNEQSCLHEQVSLTTHVAVQGKHCTGTVGCSCSGFSPKKVGMCGRRLIAGNAGIIRNTISDDVVSLLLVCGMLLKMLS